MPSPIYERRAREALRLMNEGLSQTEAAKAVGINVGTFKTYLNNGVKPKSGQTPALCDVIHTIKLMDHISAAKKLREFRFSYVRISDILNISHGTIYNWRDNGLFNEIEQKYKTQSQNS